MRNLTRRGVIGATGLLAVGSLVEAGTFAEAATPTDFGTVTWRQVQFDAANTGNADTTGSAADLRPAWEFSDVGSYGVPAAPAVADDTLFFVSTDTGDGGSAKDGYSGIVHAVSADGTERWRRRTAVAQSSVAVTDGLVVVGGPGGPAQALDAATGERRWAFGDTPEFEGSPTVADGTVYLASETHQDGTVFALDAADGSTKWAAGVGDIAGSPVVVTGVSVAAGTAYFGVGTDAGAVALYAVDAETGEHRWRVASSELDAGGGNVATPAVADGRVFFGTERALVAFDAAGNQLWRAPVDGFTPRYHTEMSPAVADGAVYFIDGPGLVAVDAATGDRRWTFEPSSVTTASSPVVVDGTVYVGTETAGVYALDAETGDVVGQYRPGDGVEIPVPPVAADGTAYVGGFSGADDVTPALTALESGTDGVASAEPTPAFEPIPDEILREMPVRFENHSNPYGDVDPDEIDDATYRWDFDADGEPEETTGGLDTIPKHPFDESGDHEVTLTVENSYGWTASTTNTVTVSEETYEGPTARIETEPPDAEDRTFQTGDTVTFDASASTPGDRNIVDYEWNVANVETRDGERIDVEFDGLCGTWHIVLTVTDELGVEGTASIDVEVGN